MNHDIFDYVKTQLHNRLSDILPILLPGGRIVGNEYICASIHGGHGNSCKTNLKTGKGSDFATGEKWGDIISLKSLISRESPMSSLQWLANYFGIDIRGFQGENNRSYGESSEQWTAVSPVPSSCVKPNFRHCKYGTGKKIWRYEDQNGRLSGFTVRFDSGNGKVVLPYSYFKNNKGKFEWRWKALPEPRPLYGLPKLVSMPTASVLLVEGEKTADAAQDIFTDYAVLTWSGGAQAVGKADLKPLFGRKIYIWPDNDHAGFQAAITLTAELVKDSRTIVKIVVPPPNLPQKWELADALPEYVDINLKSCLLSAVTLEDFISITNQTQSIQMTSRVIPSLGTEEELDLDPWPELLPNACPGVLGDFVDLATRKSEADPAAVCITTLVRFCAEIYGYRESKCGGPYTMIGDTLHPPRLFAVICGNSSKARKGTSSHPVKRLFNISRYTNSQSEYHRILPARTTSGPLSTGEGVAYSLRDITEEEREKLKKKNQNAELYENGDKRLFILESEFGSSLSCMQRQGNNLSQALREFWDHGSYSPLTKHEYIEVHNAHVNIIGHITIEELKNLLDKVQIFNGLANRFLWVCSRRSKLVPRPEPIPETEFCKIQKEFWKIIALSQRKNEIKFADSANDLWDSQYCALSAEYSGLFGAVVSRAEAQVHRLALVYALLDGKDKIEESHLTSALSMWQYCHDSAARIFGRISSNNPLAEKIIKILQNNGSMSSTELHSHLSNHVSAKEMKSILTDLEMHGRIAITRNSTAGRPKFTFSLAGDRCEAGKAKKA